MATLAEMFVQCFYQWEERGRGWYICDRPVAIEPPFTPFNPSVTVNSTVKDDGRHTTQLHFLWSMFKRYAFPSKPDPFAQLALPMPKELKEAPLSCLSISLPRSLELLGYEAEQLLLMLSYSSHPISFEVIGTREKMEIQVTCRTSDQGYVTSQIKTFYPSCTVLQSADILNAELFYKQETEVVDLGLAQEFMRPLALPDPKLPSLYLGMKGVFHVLQPNECVCLQFLFQGTKHPWAASILRSVSDGRGHSFFSDAPEMPKLAKQKTSSQLFALAARMLVSTGSMDRTESIIQQAGHALVTLSASPTNSLVDLSEDGYGPGIHLADFLKRQSRRYGMLLNTEELALFVHLPDDAALVSNLSTERSVTKELPLSLTGHAHVLGFNEHQRLRRAVTVRSEDRFTHTHVMGATGTGKSTFLLYNIIQDIQNGNGVAAIDPHGDLIESILHYIPTHRQKDVIVIDPSDSEYSVGFNILNANTELEKELLSSDLVAMFQRLSTSWGDQMNSVLANALLAFLDNTEQGTLLDARKFLLEKEFREKILKTVTDPNIQYYWRTEFPLLRTNSIGSILTRLDSFLRPKSIRYMMGQKKGLNFDKILNGQKILLVKLSHGLIGESNSYLLGSLIVSKIYQTALARQSQSRDDRKGFFVYIDEFQHYITPSLNHILTGARKYAVGLVLAHQSLDQIAKADADLASSLLTNAGIHVCFRLGENDAQKMAKGFSSFNEEDLTNLGRGEAICKVGASDMDFNLSVPDVSGLTMDGFVSPESVLASSHHLYGVLRTEIAAEIDMPKEHIEVGVSLSETEKEKTDISVPETVAEPEKKPAEEKPCTTPVVIEDPELVQSLVRRREESRHRYLQMLIKRNAESRGYKATLEQQTKDGIGRIDVVLQKGKVSMAIEVGVTTTKTWEVHNIEKCLADGFTQVIAISEDEKGVDIMRRKLTEQGILPTHEKSVTVYDLMGFMGMLNMDDLKVNPKVNTIKGYRVKVEYGDKTNK